MSHHHELLNNKYILRANTRLKERSKEMSRQMTKAEQLLWFNILSERKLGGYKFTKQKIVENYILDFYCSELLLAIEADGMSHEERSEYDTERDVFLSNIGIETIRINNTDICNNLNGVYEYLKEKVRIRQLHLSAGDI